MSGSFVEFRTLVAIVIVTSALVGAPAVGSATDSEYVERDIALDEPRAEAPARVNVRNASTARPENVSVHVIVRTREPGNGDVRVQLRYPARNESEAARAENGTIDVAWFDADEQVRTAFEEREASLTEVESSPESYATSPTASSSEYGDVVVTTTYLWDGPFASGEERFEIGPTLATHLRNGTTLRVQVPSNWTPERATADPQPVGHSGTLKEFRWRIGEDGAPAVAFNRSTVNADTDTEGQPFGPLGGAVLASSAVLLWVAERSRRE